MKKSKTTKKSSFGHRFNWQWPGLLSLTVILLSAWISFQWFTQLSQNNHQGTTSVPTATPTPVPSKAFLLLGYGGGNHDGGKLTDTMLEAYIEPEKKQVTLISVPRDLWVKIPSTNKANKINYAYAAGGLREAKQAVASVTGIKPDYAVAIDFSGFVKLLKKFEPIEVNVPYTFTDRFYPILGKEKDSCGFSPEKIQMLMSQYTGYKLETQFSCRYETISFKQGPTMMTAEQALKFVRSRHGDDGKGDFGRSQRQQALLIAIRNKLLKPTFWPKIPGLARDALDLVDTDFALDEILNYFTLVGKPQELKNWQVKTIVLDTTNVLKNAKSINGAFILLPVDHPKANDQLTEYVGTTLSAQIKPADQNDPFAQIKRFIQLNLLSFQVTPTPNLAASPSATETKTKPN